MDRSKNEQHMQDYLESLTALEKKLCETQEIFTVRGKKGRPVPIIIPGDLKHVTDLISSEEVRTLVGVNHSPYLFPSLHNPSMLFHPNIIYLLFIWYNISHSL